MTTTLRATRCVDVLADGKDVSAQGDTRTGTQLDQHHLPETNGRMAVCRRCGSHTDGPGGVHHLPNDTQMERIRGWLVAESRRMHIQRATEARATGE